MTGESLQGDMLVLKVWNPGTYGSMARPLVVRSHFYAELYRLEADEKVSAELPLESSGELLRLIGKMTSGVTGDALHNFVKNELELKVSDEGYNIYAIDDCQLAVIDYISVDSEAVSTYLQGGLDSLAERCHALERLLSEPFPRLEEVKGNVFSIMGFLEPYQEFYPSLKKVLGDKLGGEFESLEVAKVYLTVADASLAKDYEQFRAETVEPWLDMLRRVLRAIQKPE
ncbi:MAG: hypothetical protein KAJ55_05280 [Anaerolineales bacterium]|nr:hypothetical protein [Anaerolineales bacterium]